MLFWLFWGICARSPLIFGGNPIEESTNYVQEYRRRGIARTLLNMMEDYACRESGCQSVYLHVIKYNTSARRFYTKLGYNLVEEINSFYRITTGRGAHPEVQDYDACLYLKTLQTQEDTGDDPQQHAMWSILSRFYVYIFSAIFQSKRTINTSFFQGQQGWLRYLFGVVGSRRHHNSSQQSIRGNDENC